MISAKINRKSFLWIISSLLLLLIIIWAVLVFIAFGNVNDPRSSVTVERQDWYEVQLKGYAQLYFTATDRNNPFTALSENRDSAIYRTVAYGRWVNKRWWLPVSRGSIVVALDSLTQPTVDPKTVLAANIKKGEKRLHDLAVMIDDMDYYFSVHSVRDEGYELVTDYYEHTLREVKLLNDVMAKARQCMASDSVQIVHRSVCRAHYNNEHGRQVVDTCSMVRLDKKIHTTGDSLQYTTIVQLAARRTPKVAASVSYRNDSVLGLKTIYKVAFTTPAIPLNGFGLKVTPEKGVQVGEWKEGRFLGERMTFSSHRIFGIDISRFQHEKGRKKYRINWDKLRITSLGTVRGKRVSGAVDYPVSFVYIKATEGITIKSKYYTADYRQARRRGIKVGNYHFFSTRSPALAQARWYLKNSKYQKGDFPPVLDVEPSDARIRAMGGPEALFKAVRTWLKEVETKTGCRPVLYVSQSFVNRYLPFAPDIKRDYDVWIARYGEYKPDVRMLFWQLSPDGRVRGITPKVDINVFNGYSDKYDEFIRSL